MLVLALSVSLQFLFPIVAHAATISSPGKFCNAGNHGITKYFSWTDNGKTDHYEGDIFYLINSDCTQVTLLSAYITYTSTPGFVSWWDHNQYAGGWWGTGCPIVSQTGNTSYLNSNGWQAGYYFQEYLSDNGCNIWSEHTYYTNLGPLVD